jgi:hypothetical protein
LVCFFLTKASELLNFGNASKMVDNIIDKSITEKNIKFIEISFTENYDEDSNVKYLVRSKIKSLNS